VRTLSEIEIDFKAAKEIIEPQKTMKFVELMNELERDYNTFFSNPKEEELKLPSVQLYRQISFARDL